MPHDHAHAWRVVVAVLTLGLGAAATSADAKTWPNKKAPAAERGRTIYETHCVGCHGARGAGDGPAAADLAAEVPDFSEGFGTKGREELVRAVMRGKGVMPGYELVFERDGADAVIQHMSTVGTMVDTKKSEDDPEADDEAVEEEEDEDDDQREAGAPPE